MFIYLAMMIGNKIGRLGERIACKFLMKHGHRIICRNYLRHTGEIDIISSRGGEIHFAEVKTISRETQFDVNHETLDEFRAEERVDSVKLRHIQRTIEFYCMENDVHDLELVVDVIAVELSGKWPFRKFRVNHIKNVID